ncbi:hypothetical protein [Erythrobacter sp. WG]|uniref:hypothetical protein n=1 Tax=Erythrobacter sp. WG TaxID=2985510 RepID=UPI002272000E|nr:hypothetical protein [Erythrobacter sp. WG]MCX9146977.1 hypothetical protein [Erythrobacter sp. WG]
MNYIREQDIRDQTAAVMVAWAQSCDPPFTGETIDGYREAISAAHCIADEGRLILHRWVDAARRTGMSWAEIGAVLGISKQAAQQRFRPAADLEEFGVDEGEIVVRSGATAFNEMTILREEGRKGNELIGVGPLVLRFRRTPQIWEYRRDIGLASFVDLERQGWTLAASWLPFRYWKRPVAAD